MFVLMVAEILPILSDAMPGLARREKLGNRFHYWRGRSDRRYLFSAVPFEALGDFRSAVVLLAEPAVDGRFIAWAVAIIDSAGRLHPQDGSWPLNAPRGSIAFIHFLAETDEEQRDVVEDLFAGTVATEPALNLAALDLRRAGRGPDRRSRARGDDGRC
jgi:hypothetical protein